jgi:hypothetical protein
MSDFEAAEESRLHARARARELRGFYSNLLTFVVINIGLFLIDLLTGDGWWFYWPLLGWGIFVALHAARVFTGIAPFSDEWEERKTRELMDRDRSRNE